MGLNVDQGTVLTSDVSRREYEVIKVMANQFVWNWKGKVE
jgi:hypothetical protein